MIATPFPAMSSTSLIVKRDKRRRRKVVSTSKIGQKPRQGFKFGRKKDNGDEVGPAEATPVGKRKYGTPVKENTFVFRVRKDDEKDVGKQEAVDADAVSAALRAKQEKMERAEMRRLVRQKKREEATREALNEEEMKHKNLSADQISLYHLVQRQVKRELRKVRKEYLTSAARRDIMQLSEVSLQAMKQELVSFMAENPPGNVAIQLPNPENNRMRAAIETYEQQIQSLENEERKWLKMKAILEADSSFALNDTTSDFSNTAPAVNTITTSQDETKLGQIDQQEEMPCKLEVTRSVEVLQRSALQQLGSTTEKLALLDASMLAVNRWIVEAEMKKAKLFGAYHDSAFKGYGNMVQPKESLRALLELPARGSVP